MVKFTPEMIEKAKSAKTAEKLLAWAKENDVEMTEEEAKSYFAQLNPPSGELSDDELDNVSGGGCGDSGGSKPSEPSTVSKFCTGCNQTVQITRQLDSEGDIDGYFGMCPKCGKLFFNL